jgi:hypothetical protein
MRAPIVGDSLVEVAPRPGRLLSAPLSADADASERPLRAGSGMAAMETQGRLAAVSLGPVDWQELTHVGHKGGGMIMPESRHRSVLLGCSGRGTLVLRRQWGVQARAHSLGARNPTRSAHQRRAIASAVIDGKGLLRGDGMHSWQRPRWRSSGSCVKGRYQNGRKRGAVPPPWCAASGPKGHGGT